MRKIIAALTTSLDGYIAGPKGEMDWAMEEDEESWKELFSMLESVDGCILGRVMYPDYAGYWTAVLANPEGQMPITGKPPSRNDIAFARWADKTPHFLVSKTLDKVEWKNTRIVRDLKEIAALKQQPGKSLYVVGGATLVSSLVNLDLVDEVRVIISPLILGKGLSLFKDVQSRHTLRLLEAKPFKSGKLGVRYAMR